MTREKVDFVLRSLVLLMGWCDRYSTKTQNVVHYQSSRCMTKYSHIVTVLTAVIVLSRVELYLLYPPFNLCSLPLPIPIDNTSLFDHHFFDFFGILLSISARFREIPAKASIRVGFLYLLSGPGQT